MSAFAFDLSQFWLQSRTPDVKRDVPPVVVEPAVESDETLLRELVERVNAARTVV